MQSAACEARVAPTSGLTDRHICPPAVRFLVLRNKICDFGFTWWFMSGITITRFAASNLDVGRFFAQSHVRCQAGGAVFPPPVKLKSNTN